MIACPPKFALKFLLLDGILRGTEGNFQPRGGSSLCWTNCQYERVTPDVLHPSLPDIWVVSWLPGSFLAVQALVVSVALQLLQ